MVPFNQLCIERTLFAGYVLIEWSFNTFAFYSDVKFSKMWQMNREKMVLCHSVNSKIPHQNEPTISLDWFSLIWLNTLFFKPQIIYEHNFVLWNHMFFAWHALNEQKHKSTSISNLTVDGAGLQTLLLIWQISRLKMVEFLFERMKLTMHSFVKSRRFFRDIYWKVKQ